MKAWRGIRWLRKGFGRASGPGGGLYDYDAVWGESMLSEAFCISEGAFGGVGLVVRIMFLVMPTIQSLEASVCILAGSALL